MARLFGTDGVRGIANEDLTPELAFKIGRAGAYVLTEGNSGSIVVGKDTRASGDMLEAALIAGMTSIGLNVIALGVIPTPAVAHLTREYGALAGVMISASHNPGEYNGIKFFNHKGLKLSDSIEDEIEYLVLNEKDIKLRPIGERIGKLFIEENGAKEYRKFLKATIPLDLSEMKIVMDCGHGALSKIGPEMIKELNGQVIAVNTSPDGMNINDNCGSTNPGIVRDLVLENKADIGFSFDGDADRIIAVDNKGNLVDGDHILAICATYLSETGKLKNNTVVGTSMTNMGLDIYLKEKGINIIKTDVGDRYILEEMIDNGYVLGGEQSGHIIFLDHNTTGDGLATALHLLEVMKYYKKDISKLNSLMTKYPQVLINAVVDNNKKYNYLDDEDIKKKISEMEKRFHGQGRVVIRTSGTEPLVRVMIEGKDQDEIHGIASDLAKFIEERLGV